MSYRKYSYIDGDMACGHERWLLHAECNLRHDGSSSTLPTFSLSSVGLGYWAVAGVVPAYRALGKEMARQSYRLLTTPQDSETHMEIIPNETILDGKLVKEKKRNITGLPQPVKMLNVTPSFYEQYKYHIWSVCAVLLVLLGGLFVSLYFYYHTK